MTEPCRTAPIPAAQSQLHPQPLVESLDTAVVGAMARYPGAVPEDNADANSAVPVPPEVLQAAAGLFGLLASSARLQIVWMLAHGEQDVGTLADAVGLALPAVSQHLTKLKLAGVVYARREGRHQVYALHDSVVGEAVREVVGGLAAPQPARRRFGR